MTVDRVDAARTGVGPAPIAVRELERCLVCGGRRLERLALAYEFRGARFPLVECGGCHMRFLRVQPTASALAELYGPEYFASDYRCGRSEGHSFSEAQALAENRGLLEAFERLRPPGRLLEVGSAGGWLLRHAAKRGWQPQGVELSADAAAHAGSLGVKVFHGSLEEAALPAASFDLVYMGDVLEHVPDCHQTLAEVARLIAPGGFLYLRGPITTNSLARRIALAAYRAIGRTIVLREPPYHLWEFTPGSLRRLAPGLGFEIVSLVQSKIPPGRPHGTKSPLQALAMGVIDALNVPITQAIGVLGDRVVLIARKR